jgi:GT2 family glycosyltransferase
MNLSVIIPSRMASNLIPCMQSILRHEAAADMEITVVDDGVDWIGSDFMLHVPTRAEWFHVLPGQKPFIYSRNCNIGIRAAGNHDVLLVNDDSLLESAGGFTAMQHAADLHPEYGVIGAVTNVTGQPLQRPHGIGLREVPHIAFVCVLIPRRTIDRVGILDERYCLDYGVEDLDYCEACRRAGLKVGVFDGCYVDHGRLTSSFPGDPSTPAELREEQGALRGQVG